MMRSSLGAGRLRCHADTNFSLISLLPLVEQVFTFHSTKLCCDDAAMMVCKASHGRAGSGSLSIRKRRAPINTG